MESGVKGLSLLPSNSHLAGAEVELVEVEDRAQRLRAALDGMDQRYDTILLDCPPALGFLTINALAAAHSVLVPVQCEYYAMEGLGRLMESIERIRQSVNPNLEIEGILLTMYDARNSLARQVTDQIRSHFAGKVYDTVIPRNVTLAEAPSYGRPGPSLQHGIIGGTGLSVSSEGVCNPWRKKRSVEVSTHCFLR